MAAAARGGFTNATDLADYLVRKGMPFREAHEVVGKIVYYCLEKNITLEELDLARYKQFSSLVDEDVYEAINIGRCVEARRVPGGPAPEAIREAIRKARQRLGVGAPRG